MRLPKKVENALTKLEDTVYTEIRRAVESRGSAETIGQLTGLLQRVQQLGGSVAPEAKTRSGLQNELSPGQNQEPPELSTTADFLIRRGRRQNGTDFYEQRVPWETVRRFLELIDEKFGNRSFHPSSLFRDLDIPAYQAYVVLRLLLVNGQIESPRRGSYRRLRGVPVLGALPGLRSSLPSGESGPRAVFLDEDEENEERKNESA